MTNKPDPTIIAEILAADELLRRVAPHMDAIVCFASTMDEHAPNRLAEDVRNYVASPPSSQAPAQIRLLLGVIEQMREALEYFLPDESMVSDSGMKAFYKATEALALSLPLVEIKMTGE